MTITLTKDQPAKILTPAVLRIMNALCAGGETRVVGGAVRDLLLGRKIGDIDLATTVLPEQVMALLAAQDIKTVPTGLKHGTITAVVDHVGYEVTTLRRDVTTDGRHATVIYTDDWQQDAARRDFTCNALYLDQTGVIYDYFDGIEDAKAGRIKFIGDAAARINEDVLRILRFFRFNAVLGRGEVDAKGLQACTALAESVARLSAERIANETLKLLAAPDPTTIWRLMSDAGVTIYVAAAAQDFDRLEKLVQDEKKYHQVPDAMVRFAALLPSDTTIPRAVAVRLRLSNADREKLVTLALLPTLLGEKPLRHMIYRYGADNCRAALLLHGVDVTVGLQIIAAWENPTFQIKGEDIVATGIPAGPEVGEILRKTEEWWMAGDFKADRNACLAQVKQYGKNH